MEPRGPPEPRSAEPQWNRLLLAVCVAVAVHAALVLCWRPLHASVHRLRVALGLAPAAEKRPVTPRDDDWIRVVFETPPPNRRRPRPTAVARRAPQSLPKERVERRQRLAARQRIPTGRVDPVPPPPRPRPNARPERDPGAGLLAMRRSGSNLPPARRLRRRLDLSFRPAPGTLRITLRDRGRLRVAGRHAPPDRFEGRPRKYRRGWTRLPTHLRPPGKRERPRFYVTGKGVPVYAGKKLRRNGRGGWRYDGPKATFNATIQADGMVTFKDRPPVELSGVKGSPPLAVPGDSQARAFSGIVISVSFVFDLTDMVMRGHGQDPYSAEKRRFARLSRAWRLGVRKKFKARKRRAALARFGHASGLCRRYRAQTAPQRRRTRRWIFARWDETAEGAAGQPLRRAIRRAVRRCAIHFPPAELSALNATRRRGCAPFRP